MASAAPAPAGTAASGGGAKAVALKKKKSDKTKRAPGARTVRFAALAASKKKPPARRKASANIDLNVTGQTHRAYTDSNNAVRNRKPPKKPKDIEKTLAAFDSDKWLEEQMALTAAMSASYGNNSNASEKKPMEALMNRPMRTRRRTSKSKQQK